MPEGTSDETKGDLRKELGGGLESILQRIADFFDLFDLSFIVSGSVSLAAVCFGYWQSGLPELPLPSGWALAGVWLGGSYVFGLICFALGRWVREEWRWRRFEMGTNHDRFLPILQDHGLEGTTPFSEYLRRTPKGELRLHVRLWAEI